ncbi:gliding motility-associated C-terminal domain-containing protein [Pedobacter sp. KR3-3]|uniref:Gliding motility-associated C-terminal domain-containing protein n=1 Tax=Pedobacter albus TaxID=3113905 RepID=A0ABU7IBR2_9SPHI|nr:gliding motility-associated C-terminal domain-containing protein [Pedobacter sp. KR3-3]MEE1946807.1 gliding motility-associated C-terminal domain-containing protein [Pedobacter sp. KR3-3]
MFVSKLFPRLFFLLLFGLFSSTALAQQQPIPDWVKDIGGTGESKLTGIAVDKFDNVYVAGNFQGKVTVDHSGVSPAVDLNSNGNYDIFIAKYTADGKLLWARSIGGSGLDQVNNLTVDISGNVILGASFGSGIIDCDPGPGIFNVSSAGGDDALIVKLDANGNFLWAKGLGGFGTERGHVVTTDNNGNVIFVGAYGSASITSGSFTLTNKGGLDGFMVKYDPNGNTLWAYAIGSFSDDEIKSVKTDSNNDILVMGYFVGGVNLNPKGPAYNLSKSVPTYFIGKYSTNGDLVWANEIEASGSQTVSSIAVGPTNDVFLTGVYSGQIDFKSATNMQSLTAVGAKNLFVTQYNSNGRVVWARNIQGNASNPYSYYITADVENSVYIGGFFDQSLTFSDGTNSKTITYHGNRDTFFGKFSGTGDYLWAFNFGSSCVGNYGHKIAVDSKKNVLLGGAFCSTVDFNPSTCELNLTAKNFSSDGYISKFNQVKLTGDPLIISFALAEQSEPAVIDNVNKRIKIKVKEGTDVTKLRPTVQTDIGVLTPLSDTELDFTNPKPYIISSNCVNYIWTVEVTVAESGKREACSEETVSLNGEPGAPSNATFQWQIKDSNGDWINAPNTSNQSDYIFQSPANNGNGDLIIELRRKVSASGNDTYDSEYTLTLHAVTTNNLISTTQTVFCNGTATLTLDGTAPNGANSIASVFVWQQSSNQTDWTDISNSNTEDFSPQPFTQTTYFRRITKSNTCSVWSNVLKIEVYPAVTSAHAGADIQLCETSTLTLGANLPAANETGTWQVMSPVGYNPFTAANLNDPKATITNIPQNQEIILRWTIKQLQGCGSTSYAELKLYNYAKPIVAIPASTTINQGQSMVIPASFTPDPNTAYTFKWSPSTGLDDDSKLNPTASPLQTTLYTLTISYGQNCTVVASTRIIVDKTTQLDVCSENTFTLTGDTNNDIQPIFQWQKLVNGNWTDLPGESQQNLSLTADQNTGNSTIQFDYRRKVTVGNMIYYDSKYEVAVASTTFNNLIGASATVFCSGTVNNLQLTGNNPSGASNATISFSWEQSIDGASWQAIAGSSKDLTVNSLSQTTYFRRTTKATNCTSLSNILKIEVYPVATIANAGPDASYCNVSRVTLDSNPVLPNETGSWQVVSPIGYQPFTAQNVNNPKATINNLPQGQPVKLRWTIDNPDCQTSSSSELTLMSYPALILQAPSQQFVDLGKTINLGVSANLSSNIPYTFVWSPQTGLDQSDVLSPNASPTETTTYTLQVNYGDACIKTISVTVRVVKEIQIPNAFSPNLDGVNDTWEIKNLDSHLGSKLTVYNRNGTMVYQAFNYAGGWDGKHKNKPLPVGVYYYAIALNDKKSTIYTGSVTIIR